MNIIVNFARDLMAILHLIILTHPGKDIYEELFKNMDPERSSFFWLIYLSYLAAAGVLHRAHDFYTLSALRPFCQDRHPDLASQVVGNIVELCAFHIALLYSPECLRNFHSSRAFHAVQAVVITTVNVYYMYLDNKEIKFESHPKASPSKVFWPPPIASEVVDDLVDREEFSCPVLQTPMVQPSILDGYTCDREVLMEMQKKQTTNPLTGKPFSASDIHPNWAVRYAMENNAKRRKLT
jgi:hypothetical protein